jgi:RNA polymerase sigma-70 factor (ECF subfamily)
MDAKRDAPAEAELVRRAAEGDLDAMETLYTGYKSLAYAVGLAVCGNASDADDVVQETFLRVFKRLGQWKGESRFGTWLYAAALRTAQNWKSRFVLRRPAPLPQAAPVGPSFLPGEQAEEQERFMAAVKELPEQQRLTLLLKHVRGMSVREIAGLLGSAEGTVKANLHHAVTSLLGRLGRAEGEA